MEIKKRFQLGDDQDDETNMSCDDDKNSSPISGIARKKVVYRAKCKLCGILTNDPFDNLRMLLVFEMKSSLDPSLSQQLEKLNSLPADVRKYRHRIVRLDQLFNCTLGDIKNELIKFCLESVFETYGAESLLASFNVEIPDYFCHPRY